MLKQQVLEFLDMKLAEALDAVEKLEKSAKQAGVSPVQDVVVSMNTMINSLRSLRTQVEQGSLPDEQLSTLQQHLYNSFAGAPNEATLPGLEHEESKQQEAKTEEST